jgi:hypothetical protein
MNSNFCFNKDFWTTRCERCPAALTKLNELAAQVDVNSNYAKTLFLSVCLDDEDFAKELVEEG